MLLGRVALKVIGPHGRFDEPQIGPQDLVLVEIVHPVQGFEDLLSQPLTPLAGLPIVL